MNMNDEEKDFLGELHKMVTDVARSEEFAADIYKLILLKGHFGPHVCFAGLMKVMQTIVVNIPKEHRHHFVEMLQCAIKGIETELKNRGE